MYKDKYIKLTKLSSKVHNHEMPDGYWIKGRIIIGPEINKVMIIDRDERMARPWSNPKEEGQESIRSIGIMRTSQIVNIQNDIIETDNSTYKIELL
jgi:hypothetical protein